MFHTKAMSLEQICNDMDSRTDPDNIFAFLRQWTVAAPSLECRVVELKMFIDTRGRTNFTEIIAVICFFISFLFII